jgi:hypothetical protein
MSKYRLAAATQQNIRPFYLTVEKKVKEMKYKDCLIFNLDETSLLRKKFSPRKVILPLTSLLAPSLIETPVITKCTAVLCVCADGTSLPSALILPSSIPEDILSEYKSPNMEVYQTPSGYINSTIFSSHLLGTILIEIRRRQLRYSSPSHLLPALLLLDGHSSRLQPSIWS